MEFVDQARHVLGEARSKDLAAEAPRVGAARFRRDVCAVALEFANGLADCRRTLLAEKHAGGLPCFEPANRFSDSSARVGDDRDAARLRFERRDAEVLLAGKNEGVRRAQEIAQTLS